MNKKKYLQKFNRCILEYTNAAGSFELSEEGEEDMMQQNQQNNINSEMPTDGEMESNDTLADGEMQDNEMPMDGQGINGFDPKGGNGEMNSNENMPIDGMGSNIQDNNTINPDDEIIDVDDLTKSQESAEKKIDIMNDKFEKLMGAVEVLIKQNKDRERETAEMIAATEKRVSDELDKRIPTPQQRMSMRSTKSYPYSMTPNEYMNNYAPENYSDKDDNNGADDAQYKITKNDIDNITDYATISKDLDIEHQSLNDIFGF